VRSIGSDGQIDTNALQGVHWQELLDAAAEVTADSGLSPDVVFGPVHDGDVFPDTPLRATAAGLNAELPVMVGFTRHESRYWYDLDPILAHPEVTPELVLAAMASPALPEGATVEELADLLRNLEPEMSPVQIGLAGLDDCFFRQPVLRQAEAHHASGRARAYVYRLDWQPLVPRDHDFDYGSPHAADLGLVLGTSDAYPEMYGGECAAGLTEQMMDTWLAFARTGDPNHAGLPHWAPKDTDTRTTMVFDADGDTARSAAEHDPDRERREFWATVPFDGLNPSFAPGDLSSTTTL